MIKLASVDSEYTMSAAWEDNARSRKRYVMQTKRPVATKGMLVRWWTRLIYELYGRPPSLAKAATWVAYVRSIPLPPMVENIEPRMRTAEVVTWPKCSCTTRNNG